MLLLPCEVLMLLRVVLRLLHGVVLMLLAAMIELRVVTLPELVQSG